MSKATVNNQLRLAGRTAIVTGASRGIGRAVAELYAREGARVVIASRSADGSAAAAKAIEAAGGTAIAKPPNTPLQPALPPIAGLPTCPHGDPPSLLHAPPP